MWAFLIGVSDKRFLCASRLVQFVRVRDGWAQTCQQKEVGEKPKSVYSKQWKSSSNLKAFFLKKKKKLWENSFMAMQNVYVNWSAGFPESSNRCWCAAAYSAISPTLAGDKTNQEIMTLTDKINYQI